MNVEKGAVKTALQEAWPMWLTYGLLFGFAGLWSYFLAPAAQTGPQVLLGGEDVRLKIDELQPNLPRSFAYRLSSGEDVEFLVERGSDDTISVGFAACRRCRRAGHYRQGDQVLCGRCYQPMVRLPMGRTPPSKPDCTRIPIPLESSGAGLTIRASAVHDAYTRWFGAVISQDHIPAAGAQK